MSTDPLVLAVDQGSSSTKALLVGAAGGIAASATLPVHTTFPRPGWVEQDPDELADSVRRAVAACTEEVDPARIAAIGISNQRESLLLWDRRDGRPVGPLVSWQDRRTAGTCRTLADAGHADEIRSRTGLPLDPMFSAAKAGWLLDTFDPDRRRSRSGQWCLGTVDAWLLRRLTGSDLIEVGNASRTQLLNPGTGQWDPVVCELFGVPPAVLPRIVPSVGPFPAPSGLAPIAAGTPIGAVLGDSHAALYAQLVGAGSGVPAGSGVKATYGTGSSVMGLCGSDVDDPPGLCHTIAWDDGSGPAHAVEGNIRASGATIGWLARTVGISDSALADLATGASSDGVHLVPAFNGLGAPHWDPQATGLISGLTLGSGLPQLARAALESIAFQVNDVVAAVRSSVGPVTELLADGGASSNDALMQAQADISGVPVLRSADAALSAVGAARMAGAATGLWPAGAAASPGEQDRQRFRPAIDETERRRRLAGWRDAVSRAAGTRGVNG